MSVSLASVAAYAAACRSIRDSAVILTTAADNHLSVDPKCVSWSISEHATRLAQAAEVRVSEIVAFGGVR